MKERTKLFLLSLCSFTVSAAPLLVTLLIRREAYITGPGDAFRLTAGGTVLAIFAGLKATGRFQAPPRRVTVYLAVFVLSYLLRAVMADLILLSGMALAGEAADSLLFSWRIRRLRERLSAKPAAEETARELMNALGAGGRVG